MNEEKIEAIMEEVCGLCHWPFVEDQEALDARCERCPVERILKEVDREDGAQAMVCGR